MTLLRSPPAIIALYYAVALLAGVGGMPPLGATVLSAPLFVLLPTGLGLFLLGAIAARVPQPLARMQVLLLAYLVGAAVLVHAYVLAERFGVLAANANSIFAVAYALSLSGFVRFRAILTFDVAARKALWLFALIALPVLGFQYLTQMGNWADFPVFDLFQRVHFHKGALEFARFDRLNPFVADSYIPFQQVHLGLLVKYFGFDPLLGEWVLPLVTEPLRFASYYVVVMRLNMTPASRVLGLGLCLAWASSSNPTNGEIVAIAILLLISLLAPTGSKNRYRLGVFGMVVGLPLVVAGSKWLYDQPAHVMHHGRLVVAAGSKWLYGQPIWGPFLVLLLMVPTAWRWANVNKPLAGLLAGAIAIIIILPFHRASLMLVGLALVTILVLALVDHLLRSEKDERWSKRMLALAISLGVLAVVMAGVVLSEIGLGRHDEFGLWPMFDTVMSTVLGKGIYSEDVLPGLGGKTALFELGRSISVLAVGLVAYLFGRHFLRLFPGSAAIPMGRSPGLSENPDVQDYKSVLGFLVVALALMVLILTGFPFIHRAAFLPAVFINIVLAEIVVSLCQRSKKGQVRSLLYGLGAAMGLFFLVIGFVNHARPLLDAKPYLDEVMPGLLGLGMAFALFVSLPWVRNAAQRHRMLLPALMLGTAMLAEKTIVTAFFRPYAYNHEVPGKGQPIAFFDTGELAVADYVARTAPSDGILLSDPYTLSLVRARTGLNGAVSYSNLDTLSLKNKEGLLRVMRLLAVGEESGAICGAIAEMLVGGSSSELNYALLVQRQGMGRKAMQDLGYRNALAARQVSSDSAATAAIATVAGNGDQPGSQNKITREATVAGNGDHEYLRLMMREHGLRFQVIWSSRTDRWLASGGEAGRLYFPTLEPLSEDRKADFISKYAPVRTWPRAATFQLNCR